MNPRNESKRTGDSVIAGSRAPARPSPACEYERRRLENLRALAAGDAPRLWRADALAARRAGQQRRHATKRKVMKKGQPVFGWTNPHRVGSSENKAAHDRRAKFPSGFPITRVTDESCNA